MSDGKASGETSTPIGSIAEGDANSNASLKAEVARLSEQVEKQGKVLQAAEFVMDMGARLGSVAASTSFSSREWVGYFREGTDLYNRLNPPEQRTYGSITLGGVRAALNGLVVVGEEGDDVGLPAQSAGNVGRDGADLTE